MWRSSSADSSEDHDRERDQVRSYVSYSSLNEIFSSMIMFLIHPKMRFSAQWLCFLFILKWDFQLNDYVSYSSLNEIFFSMIMFIIHP